MTETPFRSFREFDLHLLDSADIVRRLPQIRSGATGIVLAKRGAAS